MDYIDYIVVFPVLIIGKVQEMGTRPPMLFIYIPKSIEKEVGLRKGDYVVFDVDGRKRIIIKKLKGR